MSLRQVWSNNLLNVRHFIIIYNVTRQRRVRPPRRSRFLCLVARDLTSVLREKHIAALIHTDSQRDERPRAHAICKREVSRYNWIRAEREHLVRVCVFFVCSVIDVVCGEKKRKKEEKGGGRKGGEKRVPPPSRGIALVPRCDPFSRASLHSPYIFWFSLYEAYKLRLKV